MRHVPTANGGYMSVVPLSLSKLHDGTVPAYEVQTAQLAAG